MKKVYIGALPFGSNENFVKELVKDYGPDSFIEVHADWINPTYEPHAIVQLHDFERAVEELDGKKYGETHLRVHVWGKNG
ncbi:MAG: RNA-binding protein [Bdellovibrionaceae bacterium]|nr:RNA-binding protein [Pseudobdellovibrionaceae bacterium]